MWAERWLRHFEITRIGFLQLTYVNALNRQTVEPFFSPDGGKFMLSDIINIFVNIGGPGQSLMQPYACIANVNFEDKPNAGLTVQVSDILHPQNPGVNVNFIVNVRMDEERASVDKIAELLDWAHERILQKFEQVFLPKAKLFFEPIPK